jgi:L-ascorbate metabolism protein UlaG (beta-lactamase superfamily)
MGFVVTTADGTFYFAGDTALTMDMQLIPTTSPALTVSLLPIGGNFTMHVEDAILAAEFVGCNKVIGLHFDTFGYIKIDKEAALKAFADAGKELILIPIGESITI